MLNTKKLLQMAKKWQKAAALGRRRIMSTRIVEKSSPILASKGHVFVYSADGKRFMIPIKYLSRTILRELFRMSEEVFGLSSDGPITLPCDSSCMEHIISLLPLQVPADVERLVLACVASTRCAAPSSVPLLRQEQHNLVICAV